MSDLIKQNLRMTRVDGITGWMRMSEYEKLVRDPRYHAYEDDGMLCADKIVESSVVPTPVIIQPTIEKPVEEAPKINSNYTGHRPKGLHYHYKFGKIKDVLEWPYIDDRIKNTYLTLEQRVYFVLTLFVGGRKAEMLELTVDDIKYDEHKVEVDIKVRLKGSEVTLPIPIDRSMPYMEDVIKLHTQRSTMKPTKKTIIRFGKIYTGIKKGKDRVPVWKRTERTERWMFLNISRGTAVNIFKRVLSEKAYPHYGRAWFLSNIGRSKEGNIVMLKSMSGIKSVQVLNSYITQSETELKKGAEILQNIVKAPNIAPSSDQPQTSL